jgi:hypothetical protein
MQLHLFKSARRWDSCLLPMDDNTLELLFQFRVRLVRIEPTTRFNLGGGTFATGNGILHDTDGNYNLDAWRNEDWDTFKRDFVGVVQRHWSDRFILNPNKPWYLPRAGSTQTAARINCGLSVQLVDTAAQAHQTYRIIHPREASFRSFADPDDRSGLFTHLDLASTWNTRMTRIGRVRHSVSFLQTTINHEFGHSMGLDHVNGAGNSDSNYGITLEQRENQMGMGGLLTGRHARPWLTRLRAHLIPRNHYDTTVHFTGRIESLQLIEYWDNDWQPTPAATT